MDSLCTLMFTNKEGIFRSHANPDRIFLAKTKSEKMTEEIENCEYFYESIGLNESLKAPKGRISARKISRK
jgi:hypothetical protein